MESVSAEMGIFLKIMISVKNVLKLVKLAVLN
jgi:hypothetical protein